MTDAYASLNGEACAQVALRVPAIGPWSAEVDFSADGAVSDPCVLKLGPTLQLTAAIVSEQAGVFGLQRKLRLVGGAGGWRQRVEPKAYHNDAGIKALSVAQDAARLVGETLGDFVPARERIGNDYVRSDRLAAHVLEDVIGAGVGWWVGFDGRTNVGQRPTAAALATDAYQVLAYDPRARVITLSCDDPAQIQIGTIIAGPSLPEPQVIREFEVQVNAQSVRILAWTGGGDQSVGRLAELWRALTDRLADAALFGLYRYRVVSMAGDGRVSLQAVRKAAGLPDIEPVAQWPGVAGTHAELAPGAEVLVAFIEGDRTQPIVTHYAGKGGAGFVPVSLTLGGSVGAPAARQGDTVEVVLPAGAFAGTINGLTASGVVTWLLPKALGIITSGSGKVKVAT